MHQVQIRKQIGRARLLPNLLSSLRIVLALFIGALAVLGVPHVLLGGLAGVALLSDFADGRLARALQASSRLGARLDQEADAVLVLVLSAVVAADLGAWVLGLGLARYAFGLLFALVPPLRTPPARPRHWCKVVAAAVGMVLTVVVALPLPEPIAIVAVVCVGVLLAESFLHETVDRWRAPRAGLRVRTTTVVSVASVWLALALPAAHDGLTVEALLRLPVEVLLVIGLGLLPWTRVRRTLAVVVGLLLGVLVLLTALDLGFDAVFDRGFDPVGDWAFLGPGVAVLGDSIGDLAARGVAVLAGLVALAVLAGLPLASVHLVAVVARHRRHSRTGGLVVAVAWGLLAVTGSQVASAGATHLAFDEVQQVRANLADRAVFARQIADDRYAARGQADPAGLLEGLAGKDVLVVFVESYGRVAVQGTSYSRGIGRVLDQGTAELAAAGYRARSAFLTSPTFGAGSWLAHSTLQSGLWVDSERRYRQLLDADRLTLTSLFRRAGWDTWFDVPADTRDWPAGQHFYRFEHYADSRNVGYAGPEFGYSPVPDQYTLEHFRRTALGAGHRPVMAEIDLTSSHHPWTPLPSLVPWDEIGDGSVFDTMAQSPSSTQVFADPDAVRRMYGLSVEYTWRTLVSFLTTYPDPDRVLVVLGDHQPHGYVTGPHPGHDVPVTVIAQDPAVLDRIAGWAWQPGLRPAPDAPVWRMDTLRDRFLAAFSG